MNKLESKAYRQINLNEGLVSAIAKFFLGSDFRSAMREVEKMKKDDPELKAALASFAQNYKIIRNVRDRLENESHNNK
jgi:hypothetical protein